MNSELVYSTAQGRICSGCRKPSGECSCAQKAALEVRGSGQVRVALETKGRKGKGVTIVSGLALNAIDLQQLATALKKSCATGGTVKEGAIEIQGDRRDTVCTALAARGIKARRIG